MGVRDRLTALRKVFGPNVPPQITAGEAAAGMTPTRPFSPGEPIGPYDGYSRTPRSQDFVTGYNIASRPRTHERVAFETLRGLVEAYDVAQMCIWHRIDSIRSLDWSLIAKKGYQGDVADAIPLGMAALDKPDRQHPFSVWLASYLYDVLAYDAGTLARLRNRRGDAIGLRVVDGTSIAPLLDYWGNTPTYPAEAYVQYVQGLPWNWLTEQDLVYMPFRKRPNSPYGHAPLESILLNANTDLRFQAYFLQRFTEGNLPAAFASAPETWSPQQIEQFQETWDAFMLGDQALKSQIRWIPPGSKIEWSNEKDFTDAFSLFLMRKTCAAYHVVPSDLGFTESVNRSSGESQADVQHRVGDLPLIRHVQGILSSFLQDDLGLPLQFAFDLGEEQADRIDQAQADKIYVEMGAISASDVREMRYGMPEPDGIPVPRFVYTTRSGPIPLASLYAVSGEIDPATAAPEPGAELPHTVFGGAEGTSPNPPIKVTPLAEQIYGPEAMPPAPPPPQPNSAVTKNGAPAAPTAGITAETGITGYDLLGQHDDEDDDKQQDPEQVAKELAAFRSFRKARQKAGRWRDFHFQHVDSVRGQRLNQAGRLAVRKATGEIAVAGLAVQAADTGRVLMLQRSLDPEDPAAGCWEFPGGHLEGTEAPIAAAAREWSEETGSILPLIPDTMAALAAGGGPSWTSGIYQGFVYLVPSEDCVPVRSATQVTNPDDPDGDAVEAIAWWDPEQLADNPAVRPELLTSLPDVLAALGYQPDDETVCPCGTPVVYDDIDGWQHADGSISHDDGQSVSDKMRVAKAGGGNTKGGSGQSVDDWPGWQHDERCAHHWAPLIAAATAGALTARHAKQVARDYRQSHRSEDEQDRKALIAAVAAWLASQGINLETRIANILMRIYTDAYLIGVASAYTVLDGGQLRLGDWQPGQTDKARDQLDDLGAAAGLAVLLATVEDTARGIADSRLADLARVLVDGAAAGDTEADIGAALQAALADDGRAAGVAITEVTTGSSAGALSVYQQRQVAEGRWITERDRKVCARCLANEAAGRVPIGQPYPSGDTTAPAHPRCRCAVLPA